jgi:CheY-like chemotaxis protein
MNSFIMTHKLNAIGLAHGAQPITEIKVAATDEACLDALASDVNAFSHIVMDENLGEGQQKGSELTQLLRQRGCTSTIISCSGNCTAEDFQYYQSCGADLCWSKPYPPQDELARGLAILRQ